MPGVALVSVIEETQSERITENRCVQGFELRKGIIKSQNFAFHISYITTLIYESATTLTSGRQM